MNDDGLKVLGSWSSVLYDAYYEDKKKRGLIGPAHQYPCFGEDALVDMVEGYKKEAAVISGNKTEPLGV